MMAFVDLTGKSFGKLTVIKLYEPEYSPMDGQNDLWECRCECGRTRIAKAFGLKYGRIRYCGYCARPPRPVKICRHCEFSEWTDNAWYCSKRDAVTDGVNKCSDYWCAPIDKVTGAKCREGKCFICGKPVYAHSGETPLYCYEHRAHADMDDKIFDEAPRELLFTLIAGIFLRAREDYIKDMDGQRTDAEVFLRGNWAQMLSVDGFDAEKVLEMLDGEEWNEFDGD